MKKYIVVCRFPALSTATAVQSIIDGKTIFYDTYEDACSVLNNLLKDSKAAWFICPVTL